MAKPTMKGALGASLHAETAAFQARLAKADAHAEKSAASNTAPTEVIPPEAPEAAPLAKVIREAFTIPENEHLQIEAIRAAMLSQAMAVSKSEVLRAGLLLLLEANEGARREVFERVERVKTGRPKTV